MKYGLIGERLSHSYSKTIHGFLGNESYELLEIPRGSLEAFLTRADFCGINVTIPYKEAVMPYCVLDGAAKEIGSVNTVVNKNGTLYGYNTDWFGFAFMAERAGITFNGKKVVILGSGGTSKTALSVVKSKGAADVVTVSRGGADNYENLSRHADCGVLINTTPVGMFPHNGQPPVAIEIFTNLSAVIDVIYNPIRSALLLDAKARGIKTAGGLSMLAAQAAMAHGLFFGEEVSETHRSSGAVRALADKTEDYFSNIVLIGMPGCGKTTAGMALAKKTGKAFVDTDVEIEKMTGLPPHEIIRKDGEPAFREIEREVIAEVSKKAGQVIATGGGSILLSENRNALAQNGTILYLERELDKLETVNRPLSSELEKLYETRRPIYESFCDKKIKVTEGIYEQNI